MLSQNTNVPLDSVALIVVHSAIESTLFIIYIGNMSVHSRCESVLQEHSSQWRTELTNICLHFAMLDGKESFKIQLVS